MTFLDTNVLIDMLEGTPGFEARWSQATLGRLAGESRFVTNLIVVAELSGQVADPDGLLQTLAETEIVLADLDHATASVAGRAFTDYRRRGGTRTTILPDFLIAAHALSLGASLMTRDRRLASYFPDLSLITPETHPHG